MSPETRAAPVCGAPFRSLHLDPSGHVRVCELNSLAMLGRIDTSSLHELWTGDRIRRIRAAVAAGDLSMGCEGCHPDALGPKRSVTHAAYYDRFGPIPDTASQWPVQLELALSNRCNLECVMCNGDLSSKIRSNREGLDPLPTVYTDEFFEELARFAPHLQRVTFIGGEPFLAPEALRAFEILIETNPTVEVQVTTNGTVATPRVERILDALTVEVSISMDGATAATYEAIRVGADFAATMRNVEWFRTRAARLSLNYCLMTNNWHEFVAFAQLADSFEVPLHINNVTSPPAFSLTHLGHEELRQIVASIAAEPYDGPNRSVIDQQLVRLTAHLETGRSFETPVHLGAVPQPFGAPIRITHNAELTTDGLLDRLRTRILGPGSEATLPPDARSAAAPPAAQSAAQSAAMTELGVLSIVSERIVAAKAEDANAPSATIAGLDVDDLAGRHLTELVRLMTTAHGELDDSTMVVHPNGEEERRLTFTSDGVTTTVCALLVQEPHPKADGPTSYWVLGILSAAAPVRAWCAAPSQSMYLDPRGAVQACCQNVMFPLGHLGQRSIGEIWDGDRRAALSGAIDAGDFSKGCDRCAPDANTDDGRVAYARVFDLLGIPAADAAATDVSVSVQRGPKQLELAMSNRCNLQCVMCNGELSSAIRAQRDGLPPIPPAYGEDFFVQLEAWLPTIERLILLGGEPFLARETTRVFDLIEATGARPRVHVTTNGTVWNSTVERAIGRGALDISVSIDALDPELFESIRVGANYAEVFENLERYRQRAQGTDSTVSVSFTLMNNNVDQLVPVLVWCAQRDVRVHVNVCNYPPTYAIFRQTPERIAEIRRIVDAVEVSDAELGCNVDVWRSILTQVRSHQVHDTMGAAPSISDGLRALGATRRVDGSQAGSDGPVVTITTDSDLLIRTVEPQDASVGEVDLSQLVGSPIHALRSRLVAHGGASFSATVDQLDGGIEVQHLRFGPHARPAVLTAVMVPLSVDDGGGLVVLLAEPTDVPHSTAEEAVARAVLATPVGDRSTR